VPKRGQVMESGCLGVSKEDRNGKGIHRAGRGAYLDSTLRDCECASGLERLFGNILGDRRATWVCGRSRCLIVMEGLDGRGRLLMLLNALSATYGRRAPVPIGLWFPINHGVGKI